MTRPKIWPGTRFAVLAAAVLVASHDLLYLAQYGLEDYHHALQAAGHGVPWTGVCLAALLAGVALGAVGFQRSTHLNRRLRDLGGAEIACVPASRLARRIGGMWLPLLAASLAAFTIQENLEHFAHHGGHLPGLEVLYAGAYTLTLPTFALLSLAAATFGSLALERLRVVAEAVARGERWRLRPAPVARRRPSLRQGRPRLHRGQPDLGRAPPQLGIVTL